MSAEGLAEHVSVSNVSEHLLMLTKFLKNLRRLYVRRIRWTTNATNAANTALPSVIVTIFMSDVIQTPDQALRLILSIYASIVKIKMNKRVSDLGSQHHCTQEIRDMLTSRHDALSIRVLRKPR
jgi:hypothetical protein